MPEQTFDNVPVRVVRSEEQGFYTIGAVVDGAFLPFGVVKLGFGDERRARAAADQADQAAAPAGATPVA